jgi:hypothetical protein
MNDLEMIKWLIENKVQFTCYPYAKTSSIHITPVFYKRDYVLELLKQNGIVYEEKFYGQSLVVELAHEKMKNNEQ